MLSSGNFEITLLVKSFKRKQVINIDTLSCLIIAKSMNHHKVIVRCLSEFQGEVGLTFPLYKMIMRFVFAPSRSLSEQCDKHLHLQALQQRSTQ